MAVRVTVFGLGTAAGGVYVTLVGVIADNAVQFEPVHPAPPGIDQITPAFAGSFVTLTEKGTPAVPCVSVGGNPRLKATLIAGRILTVAVPDFVPSAIEVAVTVTVSFGAGTDFGAV